MNRTILGGLLVATVAASAPALSAQPYNDTGSFYISPLGQYSIMDPRRESKDAFGYQVGLGANIAPNVALELDYGSISSKLKGYSGNFGPSEKLRALSLADRPRRSNRLDPSATARRREVPVGIHAARCI